MYWRGFGAEVHPCTGPPSMATTAPKPLQYIDPLQTLPLVFFSCSYSCDGGRCVRGVLGAVVAMDGGPVHGCTSAPRTPRTHRPPSPLSLNLQPEEPVVTVCNTI